MQTKIVYCMVSDGQDWFYEQALVSVYSLRQYHPEATVVLIVDRETDNTLVGDRGELSKLLTEKVVVDVPEKYPSKNQHSRYLKTNVRRFVTGDYLFIDTDTIVSASLEEVDHLPVKVGAVIDEHRRMKYAKDNKQAQGCRLLGFDINDYTVFNSGVMLVRDCQEAHDLYAAWFAAWEQTEALGKIGRDQPALMKANIEHEVIQQIEDKWNTMAGCVNSDFVRLLEAAVIIHFCASSAQYLQYSFLFQRVRLNGGIISEKISEDIVWMKKKMLEDAYYMFSHTSTHLVFFYLFQHKRSLFQKIDKICLWLRSNRQK